MYLNYDIGIKITIIGLNGIGKTSLLYRYCDDKFKKNCMTTIGIDFRTKLVERNNTQIKLQIWDTAGLEKYKSITTQFYRCGDVVIFAFDTTEYNSFLEIDSFKKEIESLRSDQKFILVGTKMDLGHLRQVEKETAEKYAKQNGFKYFEVSSKHNANINELFDFIIDDYLDYLECLHVEKQQKPEEENTDNSSCCTLL